MLKKKHKDIFLIITAILISIWIVNGTIALRNILLIFGAIYSLYILGINYSLQSLFGMKSTKISILLLIMIFFYVVYLNFMGDSPDKVLQTHELKSTWLRTLLAVIIGFTTGYLVCESKKKLLYIYLAMMMAFLFLLIQYLIDLKESSSIFNINTNNIFGGKINLVLIGSLIISGIIGLKIDSIEKYKSEFLNSSLGFIFAAITIILIMFCYTFILDTRNGILITLLLLILWTIMSFSVNKMLFYSFLRNNLPVTIIIFALITGILISQFKFNASWPRFAEDIGIAVQFEEYGNWKDVKKYGYPLRKDGSEVSYSTYERVSWFLAGISLAKKHLIGHGVLHGAFQAKLDQSGIEAKIASTHSGFLDLTLSLGLIGIFLIFSLLVTILLSQFYSPQNISYFIIFITLSVIVVYSIGELSNKQSIEILFYVISFLIGYQAKQKILNIKIG